MRGTSDRGICSFRCLSACMASNSCKSEGKGENKPYSYERGMVYCMSREEAWWKSWCTRGSDEMAERASV